MVPGSRKKRPSLSDRAPGRREKKFCRFRTTAEPPSLSFRIVFQPLRGKICTFFIRSLQKSVCFPCIPMYFHIFSVKLTGGQGHHFQNCSPAGTKKKFCFFRNHHHFQNALLGRNKKNSAADPIPKKHHLFQIAILARNKKQFFSFVSSQSVLHLFREIA